MTLDDTQYRTLREDIATLRADITERLDILSDNVLRHEAEIATLKVVSHPQNSCPIVLDVIRDVRELQQAREATNRLWKIAAAILTALLGAAAVVVEFFRR